MKVENLPQLIQVKKPKTCYTCGKEIKKGASAIHHWWVQPAKDAYDHVGCYKLKKS